MPYPVVVIGAGLSGLYATRLLQQAGQKVLLIEARERIGGRVFSVSPTASDHRLDVGPAWFWPDMNPRMESLLNQMGLASFPQHSKGAAVVEGQDGKIYKHQSAWEQSPSSYRIVGGTQALTDALHAAFDDTVHLKTNTLLLGLTLCPHAVELELEDASGRWSQLASQVVVTIPPRLWAQDMALEPAWPAAMLQDMQDTPTWMAGQAKFVAAYLNAFWREAGLSGDGISHRGPLSEIHDASDATGKQAALFGFVCASAAYRAGIGPEELKRQSLVQLVRMFGPQAATPLWQELHDWAQEPLTAAKEDTRPLSHHPMYQEGMVPSEWRERVFLAGTENALNHGGYLEGALESAELAVADLLKSIALQPPQPLALNT